MAYDRGMSTKPRLRLMNDGSVVEIRPAGAAPAAPAGEEPSARAVRGLTGLSQPAFASRLGVSVETLRNWEQGKRAPRGPARALLRLVARAPWLVLSGR
jgi:putative transcriptional regulator